MKSTVTILLLIIMLVQSFSKVLVVLHYQVNKSYIAAFLCVNKEKPQLHCEGHCYLKKELKKTEETEKKPVAFHLKFDVTLFCQGLFRLSTAINPILISYSAFKPVLYLFTSSRNTFHPPQVLI